MNREATTNVNGPMSWRKTRVKFLPESAPRGTAAIPLRRAHQRSHTYSFIEREQVILDHLPLVRCIARSIHDRLPPSIPLDDLIDTGVLGLMQAIRHYNPGKQVQLRTYAKHRIRGAILDSLRNMDWGPRLLRKKRRELEVARAQFQARTGRSAEESELASEAGIRVDELRLIEENLSRLDRSALREQEIDEENGEGVEQQPGKSELDPFRLCLRSEIKELLGKAIHTLPRREREVLAHYYYEDLTMKEISLLLGVSEARVSQLHAAALDRLRRFRKTIANPTLCAPL